MAIEDLELKLQQELSRRVVRLLPGNVNGYEGDPKDATDPTAVAIFAGAVDTSEYTQSSGLRWKKHSGIWYLDDWPGMPLVDLTGAGQVTVLGVAANNKRWLRVDRSAPEVFDLGPTSFGFSCVIEEGTNTWSITQQPGILYTGPTVSADTEGEAVLIIAKSPTEYFGYTFGSGGGGGGSVGRNSWDDPNFGTIIDNDPTPGGPGLTVGSIDFYGDGFVTYERWDVSPMLAFYSENGGGTCNILTDETAGSFLLGSALNYGAGATAELWLGGQWQECIFGASAGASNSGDWAGVYPSMAAMIAGTYIYANGSGAQGYADARGPGNYIAGGYIAATGAWTAQIFLNGTWGRGGNLAFGQVFADAANAEIYSQGAGNFLGGYAQDARIRAGLAIGEDGNTALGFADGFDIEAGGGDGNWAGGHAAAFPIQSLGNGNFGFGLADTAAILASALGNAFQFGPGTNDVARSLAVLSDFRFREGGLGIASPTVEFASVGSFYGITRTLTYDGTPVALSAFAQDPATLAATFNSQLSGAGLAGDLEAVVTSRAGYYLSVTIQVITPSTSLGKQMTVSGGAGFNDELWDVTDGTPGTNVTFVGFDRTGAEGTPRFGDFWWKSDKLTVRRATTDLIVAEEHDVIEVTGSRDLALTDRNKTLNVSGAYTLTITAAMALKGMKIRLIANGAFAMTVQQDSGATVTLTCPKGTVNDLAQDTVVSLGADGDELFLTFISDTECRVTGDVA